MKSVDQHFPQVSAYKGTCEFTQERNYFLVRCVDEFSRNGILKIHMRTHTEAKPYFVKSVDQHFVEMIV